MCHNAALSPCRIGQNQYIRGAKYCIKSFLRKLAPEYFNTVLSGRVVYLFKKHCAVRAELKHSEFSGQDQPGIRNFFNYLREKIYNPVKTLGRSKIPRQQDYFLVLKIKYFLGVGDQIQLSRAMWNKKKL